MDTVEDLAESIIHRAENKPRFMLGICGYPGAGKTTLSVNLAKQINALIATEVAAVVPMDGFHLPNSVLNKLDLRALKGIPDTFDATGFVHALEELRDRTNESVYLPQFDRTIDGSIENAIEIRPNHQIVIVEGNYLLLQNSPWNQIRSILDQIIFLDTAFDIIEPRLLQRHILGGRTPDAAKAKVDETDMPNARLIGATKTLADRVIRL